MKNISLENHFTSYSEYHQTKGNKVTHYIGIPMIVFSLLGLLSKLQIFGLINAGQLLFLAAGIFYIKLNWKKALPFLFVIYGFYFLSLSLDSKIHWLLFVIGWVFQGIGHYVYEKKSPAFLTNMAHLLIGPFWIFCNFWKLPRS